ncbi:MAG: DUF4864 domain-containing protein [Parachlamydia sp.]|jgi:hypothetical protein|nr:DUF4864 domain-containing protein [Parachlamydia sp.]
MYCQHCQNQISSLSESCPLCGKSPAQDANQPLDESPAAAPPPSKMVKRKMPFWFKALLAISVLLLVGVTAGILFTERLVDVIDKQLEALRDNDISKAYFDYSSQNFMAALSLDEFTRFVQQNPALTTQQTAHFTERSIKDNVSIMKGKLVSADHHEMPIEYRLIKEGKQWKVLSIRLLKKKKKTDSPAEPLFKMIKRMKGQLEAIKNQNFREAYDKYLSNDFKKEVSGPQFESFLRKYPILGRYKTASFYKGKEKNGVQSFSAILQGDTTAAYVKYYLVREEGKWKIVSMRIFFPEEGSFTNEDNIGGMQVVLVLLGSSTNPEGVIEHPQTSFDSKLGDLYVTLDIKGGIKGESVQMNLENIESGTLIPLKVALDESGDILVASVFSPPQSGWLKGRYELKVIPSTGQVHVVEFQIH